MLSAWDQKGTIHGSKFVVKELGNCGSQSVFDSVLNESNNGALEEDLEGTGEIRPDVTPDLDVNVVTVDVNKDIDSADRWDDFAVRSSLGTKFETHANVDGVHIDLGVASGDEDPFVSTERVCVEFGCKIFHIQCDCVLGFINCKDDV